MMEKRRAPSDNGDARRKKYKERARGLGFGLGPGMSGILVTCTRGKEQQSVRELYSIFNEYADKLYPSSADKGEESQEEQSVEDAVARELAEMKKPHKENRFASLMTQTECVVFIKVCNTIEPVSFVQYILKDLVETGMKKTRFSQRLVPFSKTCYANMNDILAMARELIKSHFEKEMPIRYAIIPKIRLNDRINRDELIRSLAELVPKQHKVSLDQPELCILIEVFKSVCGMSVVRDYYELKKHNLNALFEEGNQEHG
ncbi:uncharacterized protein VTP21DRAFT_1280 [Calcarisporiella thermophila]|uniref:uncharacterized protein n=1 Tax=Calcarisporiella thermophila TaxID=911321 RepID=UPI003742B039